MTTTNTYNLNNILTHALQEEKENDFYEFKQQYHKNNVEFIHNIICLANNIKHKGDRYLFFGINDEAKVVGIEDQPRKKQHDIIDMLSKVNFANGSYPDIIVREIKYEEHLVDVIIIKDLPYKPYYLTEDYTENSDEHRKTLRAGTIYSRVQDRNTPINSVASHEDIKIMWEEQFGLSLSPLERAKIYLCDKNEGAWDQNEEDVSFYVKFPEFTICVIENERDNDNVDDEWLRGEIGYSYIGYKNPIVRFGIKYHNTVLSTILTVTFDANKKEIVYPDFRGYGKGRIYYYLEDSIEYKFQQYITIYRRADHSMNLSAKGNKLNNFSIPVFKNEKELESFLDFASITESHLFEQDPAKQNEIFYEAIAKYEEFKKLIS